MRKLFPLLLALSGCATLQPPDDWTRRDTVMEVAFQVANAYDAHTTQRIHKAPPNIIEGMPLTRAVLGEKPDPNETAVYFATIGISHWLISRMLPPKWRPWWQGSSSAVSLDAVRRNCDNGLCD